MRGGAEPPRAAAAAGGGARPEEDVRLYRAVSAYTQIRGGPGALDLAVVDG